MPIVKGVIVSIRHGGYCQLEHCRFRRSVFELGAVVRLADPRQGVLQANRAFYEIFRLGDFARMDGLWSRSNNVSVIHPNWSGIDGRDNVMASWYQLMVLQDPPSIYPCCETVILNGSKAVVFCVEQVLSGEISASNVFAYENDFWRMTHHQAMPLPKRSPR